MAAKTVIRPAAEADIPAILAMYRQLDSALVAMQPELPETRAPASNFDCSGKGPEQRKIRKRVLACCAC